MKKGHGFHPQHILGPGPICRPYTTDSLIRLTIPHGCDESRFTVHVNALYCFTAVQTNDTTLLATTSFVLARIDYASQAYNALYQLSLFTTLLFDNAVVRLGPCIYTFFTAGKIDTFFLPNHHTDRSGTMSNPSGFAMAHCNSASPPQSTSLNTAVMTTLMTDFRQTNLRIPTDHLTALPTELLQQVVSHLSAHSIIALRTLNKAAATKTFPCFVEKCLHSLTIQTTKVGFKQALEYLQIPGASEATTHVTFTSRPSADGSKSASFAGIACQVELKALLAQLPNVTSITIRENTVHGLCSYLLCCLLATTKPQLTELTLDGCALPGSTIGRLLSAHSETLSYVAFRNVHLLTKSFPFSDIFTIMFLSPSLERVVLESLSEGIHASPIVMISLQALNTQRVPTDFIARKWTVRSGEPQQYTMAADLASMTGANGVQAGILGINTGRFVMPVTLRKNLVPVQMP